MMKRAAALIVLALSLVWFVSAAQADPATVGALPTATGAQPGPSWVSLVPTSSFSNPTFSWVQGTQSGDGCTYSGRAEYQAGVPRSQMIGVWKDTASCTFEVMTGTPTPEFVARMAFPSSAGSAPIKPSAQTSAKPASEASSRQKRTLSGRQRTMWDHVASQSFYAVDAYQYNFGMTDQLSWNGTWSSSCNAYDTTWWNGIEWTYADSTSGGTCWAGIPSWDQGNYHDITEAAASWSTAWYNDHGQCGSSGASGSWWTKLYGRGSGTVVEWSLTTGGNCGSWH